jgi:hypothetical protein
VDIDAMIGTEHTEQNEQNRTTCSELFSSNRADNPNKHEHFVRKCSPKAARTLPNKSEHFSKLFGCEAERTPAPPKGGDRSVRVVQSPEPGDRTSSSITNLFGHLLPANWAALQQLAAQDPALQKFLDATKTSLCTRYLARRDHLIRQIRHDDLTLSKLSDRSASTLLARRGNRFAQTWHPLRPCTPQDAALAEILSVNAGHFPAESLIRRALKKNGAKSDEVRHAA